MSDDLIRGLRACHSIVDDYRSKFAANLNDPQAANEELALDDHSDDSGHG